MPLMYRRSADTTYTGYEKAARSSVALRSNSVSRIYSHRAGYAPVGYNLKMSRRTYETDGTRATLADDLDELVIDKRQGWRATPAKARRRQRRYGKRLTKELRYSDTL